MKKVLILSGSPRKNGNSDILCDEFMKDSIPCTACRYCCDGCPMGLDIPGLISTYNELRFSAAKGGK